jgi:hypothetical protein
VVASMNSRSGSHKPQLAGRRKKGSFDKFDRSAMSYAG